MRRALIVEDYPRLAKVIADVARNCGYHAEVVSTVAEAEHAIKQHVPDVLWLDILLGAGGSGWTLLRRCVTEQMYRGRVVLCSGVVDMNDYADLIEEARGCFSDVQALQKPVSIEQIEAALRGSGA